MKMSDRLILIGLLCFPTIGPVSHAQEQDSSYIIEGVIFDPELSRPMRWQPIDIVNKKISVQADSNGYFVFHNLWADTFVVATSLFDLIAPVSGCRIKVSLSTQRRRSFIYLAVLGAYSTQFNRYRERPPNWRRINVNNLFSFCLPPEFERVENSWGGTEKYTVSGMNVKFDYGHGSTFGRTLQDGQEKVLVGCKKAIISRYYYPESTSPTPVIHAIDFDSPRLTLWVEYTTSQQEDDVLRILYSVILP
jgi:hypothetical protein